MTSRRELLRHSPSGMSENDVIEDRTWSKCCSVFCNSTLLLVAFLSGGVSLWAWTEANKFPAREGVLLVMGAVFQVCLLAPAVECFVAMVGAFSGLYGVHYRKRSVLLLHFSIVLIGIVTALIFAIITAYNLIMPENVPRSLEMLIDRDYGVYGNDDVTRSINILQMELTCCGSLSYESWADSEWIKQQRLARFQGDDVPRLPLSCCQLYPNSTQQALHPIDQGACQGLNQPVPNEAMYQQGCAGDVMNYTFSLLLVLVCSQVGLFLIQLLVIITSVVMLHHIRSDDPELARESEYIAKLYNSLYQKYGGNISLNIHQKGVKKQVRVDTPVAFANLVYIDMPDFDSSSEQSPSEATSRL